VGDKIGLIGVGAVGSYVGAFLTKEGHDLTLIDMWPEHVEAMRQQGLRVSSEEFNFTVPVKAMHLTDAQGIQEPFDFAIVSVKSYDTEWATHFIKRYVKPEGFFLSIQNCWNDPVIGDIVGSDRALGSVASSIEVALWEPGHVVRGGPVGRNHGHTVFRVGEQDERITPRSERVAALLDLVDAAYASDNLWGERWGKLCQNSMGNAISAMSQLGSQEMAQDSRCRLIRINLAKETAQVGLAMGLKVVDAGGKPAKMWAEADKGDVFEELDDYMSGRGGRTNWLASMAQDVKKGRRSEIDQMNGLVARKGRELSVSTPFTDAVVDAMHGIDDGSIAPGPANIDRILKAAGR
tara:strand:+ start:2453 stop:3502 length:1050 start_codon:yes stop_codon:yes gene_type:complete